MDAIEVYQKPELPVEWNYDDSVAKLKAVIYKWKNFTKSMAGELWVAREKLSSQGLRNKSSDVKTWSDYCVEIGTSRQVVNRWLALWFGKTVHVSLNSGENEWYTPKPYIESAKRVMGSIDLDPASCELANKNVQAEKYFTQEDNGLEQTWNGNVWMNPPYAQPLISEFASAITQKYFDGEINQACVLVNNATETGWFQEMLEVASAVCFVKGRIKFIDTKGNPGGAPLQGQAILYMGKKPDVFCEHFNQFGTVLWKNGE